MGPSPRTVGLGVDPPHVAGRAALDGFARAHRAGPHADVRHHITNVATWPAAKGARGRAAILYVKGKAVLGSGLYEDDLI
jgi:hypothetical protein